MAPNMVSDRPDVDDFKADWNCSSLHERLISPGSKEEKINAYKEWAENYDRDVSENGYLAPISAARILVSLIISDPRLAKKETVSVVDAGCGTGLTFEAVKMLGEKAGVRFQAIGLDYSPDMLEIATKKGIYDRLASADLNESMPVNGQKFDFAIATGVFLEGHCGPPALVNILDGVAPSSYAVISVRNESFKRQKEEYYNVIAAAGCTVTDNKLMRYMGPVVANYLTIQKSPITKGPPTNGAAATKKATAASNATTSNGAAAAKKVSSARKAPMTNGAPAQKTNGSQTTA